LNIKKYVGGTKMHTLLDVLRILARLGVEPGEIEVPRQIHRYLIRQARELQYEEKEGGTDDEDDPY